MQSPSHLSFSFPNQVEGNQSQAASRDHEDSGMGEIAGKQCSPHFIRRKCKESQHSQTSLTTTLITHLLLSGSIYIVYNLFALLQLLVSFTGGTTGLCISVAYIKAGFCSHFISPSSTHLFFCIEQVRQVRLRLTVPRKPLHP
jgi:hypothetical protein